MRNLLILLMLLFASVAGATEIIENGDTDVSVYVVIRDDSGDPCTGLTITDVNFYWVEYQEAQESDLTVTALGAANSAHSDGKMFHTGFGLFRCDFPDDCFDGGANTQVTLIVADEVTSCNPVFLTVMLSPAVDSVTVGGATPLTKGDIAQDVADYLDANGISDLTTVDGIVDAILVDTGTTLDGIVDSILVDTGTTLDGKLDTIITDTNELQTDWANGGRLDTILDTASSSVAGFDSTTVSSATSTSVFVIADGVVSDNVYNGILITVTDADGDGDPEPSFVDDYDSSTKTIMLATALSFTPASGDTVLFLPHKKAELIWTP